VGGEDGVEMSGEKNAGSRAQGRGFRAQFGKDVAGLVEVRVGQAELLEAVEEPSAAGGFAEGWGGDAD